MPLTESDPVLRPELRSAIERKGYTELTAVQRAVLDPELAARDLRVSSQTGSGKTLAIGFMVRDLVLEPTPACNGIARPKALVITPTRELAQQVEQELTWLYADSGVRVASTTGGASYRNEQRALGRGPAIVVGTPGRLLDHLKRGAIDPSAVAAVVLDEADRMLELGFREDIEAIFARTPAERATHLVSATFPRALRTLADRVQRAAVHVEGTALGAANSDIDHVIHIVDSHERLAAIVNLLLAHPEDQTLVFVRTRADASELAAALVSAGFAASALSGEMEQAARNRALAAFRGGAMRVMVATDVAARGIDVQSVSRVLHAELPTDPDAYTHRSGRTGRAGRKGVSALLVAPSRVVYAARLLRGLGVPHRYEAIPTPAQIKLAEDDRLFALLTAEAEAEPADDARFAALAARLIAAGGIERSVARLLALRQGGAQPREVRAFDERVGRDRGDSRRGRDPAPRTRERDGDGPSARNDAARERREFVPFRVSWGKQRGADARRLLAMLCRRGQISGSEVGPIRVEYNFSVVGVDSSVAEAFERAAGKPDPREPSVLIRRDARPERHAPETDHDAAAREDPQRSPQPRAATFPRPKKFAPKPPTGSRPFKRKATASR